MKKCLIETIDEEGTMFEASIEYLPDEELVHVNYAGSDVGDILYDEYDIVRVLYFFTLDELQCSTLSDERLFWRKAFVETPWKDQLSGLQCELAVNPANPARVYLRYRAFNGYKVLSTWRILVKPHFYG